MADEENHKLNRTSQDFSQNIRIRTFRDNKVKRTYRLTESFSLVAKGGCRKTKKSDTTWWFNWQPGTKTNKVIIMIKTFKIECKNQKESRLFCSHEDAFCTRTRSSTVTTKAALDRGPEARLYDRETDNVRETQVEGNKLQKWLNFINNYGFSILQPRRALR